MEPRSQGRGDVEDVRVLTQSVRSGPKDHCLRNLPWGPDRSLDLQLHAEPIEVDVSVQPRGSESRD